MGGKYKKFCACKDQADLIAMAKRMEEGLIELQQKTGLCSDFLVAAMQLCVSVQISNDSGLRDKLMVEVPEAMVRAFKDMDEIRARAERDGAPMH